MRTLYSALLRLYPKSMQEQYTEEMFEVHCDAAQQARSVGSWHYVLFCFREVSGLLFDVTRTAPLGRTSVTRFRWIALGGLIGLGLAAFTVNYTEAYRSTAVLRIGQPRISNRYVAGNPIDPQALVRRMKETLFSRASLVNIIQTYALYPREIKRVPIEDVIETMRQDLEIKVAGEDTFRIGFTYRDNVLAQKVVSELVGRIFSEYEQSRKSEVTMAREFLSSRVEDTAREWADAEAAMKKAQAVGGGGGRLQLDLDLARDHYKSASDKLSEARTTAVMEARKLGPNLEMLDSASLPLSPTYNSGIVLLTGFGGGVVLGFLVSLLLSFLPNKTAHSSELNA